MKMKNKQSSLISILNNKTLAFYAIFATIASYFSTIQNLRDNGVSNDNISILGLIGIDNRFSEF